MPMKTCSFFRTGDFVVQFHWINVQLVIETRRERMLRRLALYPVAPVGFDHGTWKLVVDKQNLFQVAIRSRFRSLDREIIIARDACSWSIFRPNLFFGILAPWIPIRQRLLNPSVYVKSRSKVSNSVAFTLFFKNDGKRAASNVPRSGFLLR